MKHILYSIILIFSLSAQDEFSISSVKVGGYGELHINSIKTGNSPTKTTADFHRFVLFFGLNFTDKWSFRSELELEHNYVKDGDGELELEQAYVEYLHSDEFGFRGGVLLAPVGYLNEIHEPPTFLGVERPTFDSKILPTTWFDNGLMIFGTLYEQWTYHFAVLGGLNGNGIASGGIRSGRTKGYKGEIDGYNFNNPTFITRVDYIGYNGLNVGASYTMNDAIRYTTDTNGKFADFLPSLETSIFEFHAKYERDNLYLKAQYGLVSFDKKIIGYDGHVGGLIEIGYDVLESDESLIPFIRYEDLNMRDNNAALEDSNHESIFTIGLNYEPISQIAIKADYSTSKAKASGSKSTDTIAFGIGYMF